MFVLLMQVIGVCLLCVLLYELYVSVCIDVGVGMVMLKFVNIGYVVVVFYVYDKLYFDWLLQCYVVELGKMLYGDWVVCVDNGGKYDLWVFGLNGYYCCFIGDLSCLVGVYVLYFEVCVGYVGVSGNFYLWLCNDGGGMVCFMVKLNQVYGLLFGCGGNDDCGNGYGYGIDNVIGYGIGIIWIVMVCVGDQFELYWKFDLIGYWYDFIVIVDSDVSFLCCVVGCVEIGCYLVSDLVMGFVDCF